MLNKQYRGINKINGPLITIKGVTDIGFDEMVKIIGPKGDERTGRVLQVSEDMAVIQVFEGTTSLDTNNTSVKFLHHTMEIPLSRDILGRVFSGTGEPIDEGGKVFAEKKYDINGAPINPYSRQYPRNYIETGISAIDGLATLIRGQKLPIFSGNGLPHNQLAAQITRQARIEGEEEFAIVFVGMGIKHDDAEYFQNYFSESGVLQNVAIYMNLADDPTIERIIAPRVGLTAAEYLAFEENMHVLVILTDMTNYCEALRELSSRRGEIPSRKGYPGYLYSDLAGLYERAGMIKEYKGSITQIPILSMPNDDITHPIPDLTGYITEGQLVLDRELFQKGIYPPIDILPSLSRLMKDGIGEGYTREDHAEVSNQLYSAYSRVQSVRSLASVIGEEELSEIDQTYLKFGEEFEENFLQQEYNEDRSMEKTLDLSWEVLSILPRTELNRVSDLQIKKHYQQRGNDNE